MAADQAKLRKRLEVILKLPENQICCDCRKRGPRWASANLGVFMCIECSGIHRNLGVHISFVRSVNLDSWTNKQVEFMEEWGNGRANEYWEANVPASVHRPKEGDSVRTVEKYIRDKYEHKRYIAREMPPAKPRGEAQQRVAAIPDVQQQTVREETQRKSQPAQAASAPPKPSITVPAPVEQASLIDFLDDEPAPAPVQQQQQQQAAQFDPFAPQCNQPTQAPATFTNFDQPAASSAFSFQDQQQQQFPSTQQQQPQQQHAVKPQASADQILSMFGGGGAVGSSGMMGGQHVHQQPMFVPSQPPHGGTGMGMSAPAQQQQQHQYQQQYMMNSYGMHPQQQHFQQQQFQQQPFHQQHHQQYHMGMPPHPPQQYGPMGMGMGMQHYQQPQQQQQQHSQYGQQAQPPQQQQAQFPSRW